MLELTYSNRTEALVALLAGRIRTERAAGKGAWETVHLVAPSPTFKEYLRIALARELGVAANIRFTYLDSLWKDLLAENGMRLLTYDLMRAGLLGVLGDREKLAAPEMAPVRDYLGQEQGLLKRVQLAAQLARLFEEYQFSRHDWIEAWRKEQPAPGLGEGNEAWQRLLWLEVVRGLDAAAASAGGRAEVHVTLLELVRSAGFRDMRLPRAIHAFGLTHVAQAYQEVFQAFEPLADTTLHLYALNPCGEFWEDLDTRKVALWTGLPRREEARLGEWDGADEDFYGLAARGPLALRLWGRPGREKIRLLNEVSQCDFTSAFEEPAAGTLLGRLQRDVLLYRDPAGEPQAPDASIQLLACASPRREAEAVATEIWRLLERHQADPVPLSFSDIAVAVPAAEEEAYVTHLQAACHDAQQIPLVRGPQVVPLMAQLLEAVELLLELPTSGLTRAALLRLLEHPGLRRRLGPAGEGDWERWCEELGIVRGADRAAWEDSYLAVDALNWDQGLRRLVLGQFMDEGAEFLQDGQCYRVEGAREPAAAAAFIAQVRGLCADARNLLERKAEPRAWVRRLSAYLAKWLEVDEGEEAEAVLRALERIRGYLERQLERVPEALELPVLDFPAARHLALEALERLKGDQPSGLTRGVVVASHAALRAIPFRVVILMGNGEGRFPTRDRMNALDLRRQGRRPGDVSPAEREKYLFLELLLSAREHLVLSYVGLDELSGEVQEPSGLFKEFLELLDSYLPPADAVAPRVRVHPLRRYDAALFPTLAGGEQGGLVSYSEPALREAVALHLGERARAGGGRLPRFLGELEPAAARAQARALLDCPEVPSGRELPEVLRISLADLKAFLECPLSGAARVRLGMRERELEDRAAVEDEPFETDALDRWGLCQEVALAVLGAPAPLDPGAVEPAYEACLRRSQARGEMPFGVFAEVERAANLARVRGWVAYLAGRGEGRPETWRLGVSRSRAGSADHPEPALRLQVQLGGQSRRVELVGDLRPQLGGSLFLEKEEPPTPSQRQKMRKKALGAYLDHLVLACLGQGDGHLARFVHAEPKTFQGSTEPVQELRYRFPALDRDQAQARLRALVEDLLGGEHQVLLPIEAVIKYRDPGQLTPEAIREFLENAEEDPQSFISTLVGPVPDPLRFDPPERPGELVQARLGAFLEAIREEVLP
jgi:exodeoxyribonuclease V gamma subunit